MAEHAPRCWEEREEWQGAIIVHMPRIAQAVLLAALAGTFWLSGCAHKKHAQMAPPPPPAATRRSTTPPAPPPVVGSVETGVASWYGHPYHGRAAADGEIYDMETLVAAHRTLPFNTWVRVYDVDNGKSVDVRIIDRGPFVDGRIIDLSHAAATSIGMIGPGIANVRVEILQAPQPLTTGVFAVQVGAFRDPENAERVRAGNAAFRREPGSAGKGILARAGGPRDHARRRQCAGGAHPQKFS